MNALKYRCPLRYLGMEYEDVVVPCTPAYELEVSTPPSLSHDNSLPYFVKGHGDTRPIGLASGKRSALYIDDRDRLLRFKGCGNEDHGFNR
jgi:hypothetical protein